MPIREPQPETTVTLPDGAEAVTATVLTLRQGDILVVTYPERWSMEYMERIGTALKERLPDGIKVIVMDAGAQLSVLRQEQVS